MPNLGNDALNLILDLATSIGPALVALAITWVGGMLGRVKMIEGNSAAYQLQLAVAQQICLAVQQSVAAADKQGKFLLAAHLISQRFPRLNEKKVAALIEAGVAWVKTMPNLDTITATKTSASMQQILDALNAPGARARFAADANAITQDFERRIVSAEARLAAVERAATTPAQTTGTGAKKVVATVTPAATPPAPAQP